MATTSVNGPSFLALQVDDVDRAARFYEDTVGMVRAPQSPPGAVVFATAPIAFGVRSPLPGTDLATGLPGLGVALWFACDDAPALHDRLVSEGVEIVTPLFDGPFGATFVFRDPQGYAITMHTG